MAALDNAQNTETALIVRSNADEASDRFSSDEYTTLLRAGIEFYHDFQQAFDHFNDRLWDGQLPDAIIVGTRKKNVKGYFAPGRSSRSLSLASTTPRARRI